MVSALATCSDNSLLFTGDSSGYIKVWDISHYLVDGRSCTDTEHAKRQVIWDTFPTMKWLQYLEQICKLHLDFRCMTTAHEPGKPHLLNSFRGHLRLINSIEWFENQYGRFLLTASVDCSIRLWTIGGLFMGIYGQSRLWDLNADNQNRPRAHRTDAFNRPRGYLLPPDIRKSGSCTTLRVMNGFTQNRWIPYVNLIRALNAFLSVFGRSTEDRIANDRKLEAQLEIPVTEDLQFTRSVVESIAPKARQRPPLFKPRIPQYRLQCPAYRVFPLQQVDDIDFPLLADMLNNVKVRYDLPRRDHLLFQVRNLSYVLTDAKHTPTLK
ncbi:hypothetical protein NP493_404g02062 [Ridgeia piscesae]|uniref:WD repeat-containing protein on Y chromosome n=1 Tax=Ridgeia piscesae TaxID=27915 RepID=A0AAD9NUM0_RIDPI|nr:hypothetical protein NP493_404g02062 [Ridgeia piscesae]